MVNWGVIGAGGLARRRTISGGGILAKGTISQVPIGKAVAYLEKESKDYAAELEKINPLIANGYQPPANSKSEAFL